MKHLIWVSVLLLLALPGAPPGQAQPAVKKAAPPATGPEPAPLVVWNRQIAVFRAPIEHMQPKERALNAARRIENIPENLLVGEVRVQRSQVGDYEGFLIFVDHYLAFGLVRADLDPLGHESLDQAAAEAAQRLRDVLEARATQRNLPLLLRGLGLTVAATGLLVLALWLVARARRRCLRWLEASHARLHWLKLLDIDLRTHVFHLEAGLVGLLAWISWLGGIYVWATFVLSQFPYTHPWGDALGIYLESLVSGLAFGVIDALPGLGMVLAIFLVTRFLVRLLANLFLQIEGGHIRVDWLLPETARATRRLFVVLAWLFAVTVAYPYLPGSDSEAFKGLSVLVGLMISLGSAGVVNQVMSGFVVLYARAIRTGDYVRIGEVEGVVTELGTLSTKVVTRRKEEITIPNALVIGTSTINYSRLANADGAIVATTVTIGYDAPWRQVHALLLLAAERTPGVRKQPRPSIMQKALADFYVEYVLLFAIDRPEDRLPILSDLHAQIQDAFNEFGVQIMSPHFEKQPEKPVLSPAERWHAPPAAAPDRAPSP